MSMWDDLPIGKLGPDTRAKPRRKPARRDKEREEQDLEKFRTWWREEGRPAAYEAMRNERLAIRRTALRYGSDCLRLVHDSGGRC